MPENEELLAQCLKNPTDTHALRVYCDGLQQTGDPRAGYARLQLELKSAPRESREAQLARLRTLYPVDHPTWRGRFEHAGVFEANLLAVKELWWGIGLGAPEAGGTYQRSAYHQQPPLPVEKLNDTYDWLREAGPNPGVDPNQNIPSSALEDDDPEDDVLRPGLWSERLAKLRQRGYYVPASFERFMEDRALQAKVPSCTSNYFLPAADADEHPQPDGGLFLTFYSDQQACLLWGVRLGEGADRYTPVLAGAPQFSNGLTFPELAFCAPTVETFVYRWWLENTLWFATQWADTRRALTHEEQAYFAHLERRSKA